MLIFGAVISAEVKAETAAALGAQQLHQLKDDLSLLITYVYYSSFVLSLLITISDLDVMSYIIYE